MKMMKLIYYMFCNLSYVLYLYSQNFHWPALQVLWHDWGNIILLLKIKYHKKMNDVHTTQWMNSNDYIDGLKNPMDYNNW
jgi:hypothetical protein